MRMPPGVTQRRAHRRQERRKPTIDQRTRRKPRQAPVLPAWIEQIRWRTDRRARQAYRLAGSTHGCRPDPCPTARSAINPIRMPPHARASGRLRANDPPAIAGKQWNRTSALIRCRKHGHRGAATDRADPPAIAANRSRPPRSARHAAPRTPRAASAAHRRQRGIGRNRHAAHCPIGSPARTLRTDAATARSFASAAPRPVDQRLLPPVAQNLAESCFGDDLGDAIVAEHQRRATHAAD